MALILKTCAIPTEDGTGLNVTDVTGIYSAINTGGYGSPNVTIANVTIAALAIYKRNEDGTFTQSPTTSINVYPTLPNTTNTSFLATAEAFGYGIDSVFEDGIYRLQYVIAGISGITPFTYSDEIILVIKTRIDCCVKKKAYELSLCDCDCDGLNKKFANLMLNYRLLLSSICCASLTDINEYIKKVTKLCADCECCY